MKKLLCAILVSLTASVSMAFETAKSVDDLVSRATSETKLVAVVFVKTGSATSQKMLRFIKLYEQEHKDVVFFVANRNLTNMQEFSEKFGAVTDPSTLVSIKGRILHRLDGLPPSMDEMKRVMNYIQQEVAQLNNSKKTGP